MINSIKSPGVILLIALTLVFFSTTLLASEKKKSDLKDIVSVALEAGNFNTLAAALTEAGLVKTLQGDGPFTVFAPTDEAFSKLPEGTIENLLKDKEALTKILLYHVVVGKVSSEQVINLNEASTVMGKNIDIKVVDGQVFVNNSKITVVDIKASNGVIHVIDSVLIP